MGTHTSKQSRKTDDIRRVLDGIRRIVRVLRVSAVEAEKDLGLSAAQLFVLHKLGDGQTISVNDLAERTHTHQSSVSVVVQRLVNKRLVRRTRSVADGRRAELTITAAGLRRLKAAPEAAQDRLIASLENMSARDRARLSVLLEDFVAGTGIAEAGAPGLFFEEGPRRHRGEKTRRRV